MTAPSRRVLAINSGSSSLKAAAYEFGPGEERVLSVESSRIRLPGSRLRVVGADERVVVDGPQGLPDHEAALQALFRQLDREHPALRRGLGAGPDATGPEPGTPLDFAPCHQARFSLDSGGRASLVGV